MVEMDVGIIAASLVVMRPCFQFLYNIITGRSNDDLLRTTRTGGAYSGSKLSSFGNGTHLGTRRERKMGKTVDIEMESRLVGSRVGSVGDGTRDSFGGVAGAAVQYEVLEYGGKGVRS